MNSVPVNKITHGGFLRKDLRTLFLTAAKYGDIETACYASAELTMTGEDEIEHVCTTLVDLFAEDSRDPSPKSRRFAIDKRNGRLLKLLADTLDKIITFLTNNKKGKKASHARVAHAHELGADTKAAICRFVVAVSSLFLSSKEEVSDRTDIEEPQRQQQRQHPASRTTEDSFVRLSRKIAKAFSDCSLPENSVITLTRLYVACVDEQPSFVRNMITHMYVEEEHEAWPKIVGLPEIEDVIRPRQRADVAWYLWKLCLMMTSGSKKAYVLHALSLFRYSLKKANRFARLPLLLCSYEVAMRTEDEVDQSGQERDLDEKYMDLLVQAEANSDCLYTSLPYAETVAPKWDSDACMHTVQGSQGSLREGQLSHTHPLEHPQQQRQDKNTVMTNAAHSAMDQDKKNMYLRFYTTVNERARYDIDREKEDIRSAEQTPKSPRRTVKCLLINDRSDDSAELHPGCSTTRQATRQGRGQGWDAFSDEM